MYVLHVARRGTGKQTAEAQLLKARERAKGKATGKKARGQPKARGRDLKVGVIRVGENTIKVIARTTVP